MTVLTVDWQLGDFNCLLNKNLSLGNNLHIAFKCICPLRGKLLVVLFISYFIFYFPNMQLITVFNKSSTSR